MKRFILLWFRALCVFKCRASSFARLQTTGSRSHPCGHNGRSCRGSRGEKFLVYGVCHDQGSDNPGAKAALLSGAPGVGKSSTATLVARELGYHVMELNASDTRNKQSLSGELDTVIGNQVSRLCRAPVNHACSLGQTSLRDCRGLREVIGGL